MSTSDVTGGLPEVRAAVMLHLRLLDGASVEVPSRVCDIEDRDGVRHVVVDRPDLGGVGDVGTFAHEREGLVLVWVRQSGQMQVRATAAAASRPYGPVWVLTPIGAPTREQRREYFRIPLDVPAMLTPVVGGVPTEDTDRAVRATLVEVGEGGAVISCEGDLPEPGTLVDLSFTLQDKAITAASEVLRHVVQPTGRPRAALRFLDPTAYGDHIRRFAFDLQRTRARMRLE